MGVRTLERSSVVPAPPDEVWARVTSRAGLDDEMWPLLRMRPPRHLPDLDVATLPVGRPAGRCWLLLLGVLPVDYDDLTVTELEPGRMFQERSTMLSMRRWEHRRTLEPVGVGRTRVTDLLGLEPRLRVLGPLLALVVRGFFAHRHRRLARWSAAR